MYNILKSYETKNENCFEYKRITLNKAKEIIAGTARLWEKNGGIIISRTDEILICQEANAAETITWTIKEVKD